MTDKLKATVFIPVYNGENDHLEETLTALYAQKPIFMGSYHYKFGIKRQFSCDY